MRLSLLLPNAALLLLFGEVLGFLFSNMNAFVLIWIQRYEFSWINSHWNDWGSLKSYQQKYCFYLNRLIISQWNPWNLCLEMLLIDLISCHSARIIWIATRAWHAVHKNMPIYKALIFYSNGSRICTGSRFVLIILGTTFNLTPCTR